LLRLVLLGLMLLISSSIELPASFAQDYPASREADLSLPTVELDL
jgi:hypothetical protein